MVRLAARCCRVIVRLLMRLWQRPVRGAAERGNKRGSIVFNENAFLIGVHVCTRTPMGAEKRKHLARQCVMFALLSKRV